MDVNAGLVDQRVQKLVADHLDALAGDDAKLRGDAHKLKSRAFTAYCVMTALDLPLEDALDRVTDASHDLAIDALHVDGPLDGEFTVTLFQAKYRQKLDGEGSFPANDVQKVVNTVQILFDPQRTYDERTPLAPQIEEIRSFIADGELPNVKVFLCNNGKVWRQDAEAFMQPLIDSGQVSFEHFNHDRVIELLRKPKAVDHTLRLTGQAVVESFNFRRVLVGKLPVTEVAALLDTHGDRLLERNIRRYLGRNRVNQAIEQTLRDPEQRTNFYFFNNGVTLTCRQFQHNGLQAQDFQVRVKDLQIINGGQTCVTIQRALKAAEPADYDGVYVMVRLYELGEDDHEVVQAITYATNSQNPVNLQDLRANDPVQQQLELGLEALGYTYLRKRGQAARGPKVIRPMEAAQACMAVLQRWPDKARFQQKALFGRHYDQVFGPKTSAAQVALAVEIQRAVDAAIERGIQRPDIEGLPNPPRWLPYAAPTLAMLLGDSLNATQVDHTSFDAVLNKLDAYHDPLIAHAVDLVDLRLLLDGVDLRAASLQKLSAVFRRSQPFRDSTELRAAAERLLELSGKVDPADLLKLDPSAHWGWHLAFGMLQGLLIHDAYRRNETPVPKLVKEGLVHWGAGIALAKRIVAAEAGT